MKKRIISLVLTICMIVSLLPSISIVGAEGEDGYTFFFDFTRKKKTNLLDLKREDTLGIWTVNSETVKTAGDLNSQSYGFYIGSTPGQWTALDVNFSTAGTYSVNFEYNKYNAGGTGSIYLLPGNATDIGNAVTGASSKKLGTIDYSNEGAMTQGHTQKLSDVTIESTGKYILVFYSDAKSTIGSKRAFMFPKAITFTNGNDVAAASVLTNKNSIDVPVGGKDKLYATSVYTSDNKTTADYSLTYISSDESIAKVSSDGTVEGVSVGEIQITVTATVGETSVSHAVPVSVYKPSVTSVLLSTEKEMALTSEKVNLSSKAIFNDGVMEKELSPEDVEYMVVSGDANVLDGAVSANTAGKVVMSATYTYDGAPNTSNTAEILFAEKFADLGYSPYTYIYDFRLPKQKQVVDITREDTKGIWSYKAIAPGRQVGTFNAGPDRLYFGSSLAATHTSWAAFDISVPYAGKYMTEFGYAKYNMAGQGSIYLIPGVFAAESIEENLTSETKVGEINYSHDTGMQTGFKEKLSDVEFPEAGIYTLVFKLDKKVTGNAMFPAYLKLYGDANRSLVSVVTDKDNLLVATGESDTLKVSNAYMSDASIAQPDGYSVSFESADNSVAEVDEKTGKVTGLRQGDTDIIVTATSLENGISVSCAVPVKVLDLSLTKITMDAVEETAPYLRKIPLTVTLNFNDGAFVRNADFSELTYNVAGNAAVVDGKVRAESAGEVTVSAVFTFDGQEYTSNEVTLNFTESTKKTAPTYFTYEKREQARANAKKYNWAADTVKSTVKSADKHVENIDIYYNGIFGEGVPRSAQVGSENDPQWQYCRYCGSNIGEKYTGNDGDGYSISPITRPWKIQCRDCKRYFPSNDFGLLYERGLDEHGYYDRDRAVVANAEAVARGEKDALKNELYPEIIESNVDPRGNEITWGGGPNLGSVVDPTTGKAIPGGMMWGVDDGLGYLPGREYDNGLKERHTYIAFYGYYYWYQIRYVTNALANAYVYTDDPKYGRAGALLIDRVADVFPSFSFRQWDNDFLVSHGGSGYGKIAGRINDCQMTQGWITCADAFFPILSDETLIKTLSEKSKKFNLSNPKTSAELIWENWSDGILRETFKACKEINISGNYGMQQWALSSAALVLDSEPESREMVEWVFRTETEEEAAAIMADPNFKSFAGNGRVLNKDGTEYCVGGYLGTTLVDSVDRDGMGNEGSPNYNLGWALRLYPAAEMLNMYTDDPKYNIYKNPKFMKMFTAGIPLALTNTHTAQIGDSGATAGIGFLDRDETIFAGFENLKDTEVGKSLAKYIYIRNGYSAEGLKYGIFHPDPGSMETDVLKLVDGEDFTFPSALMSGFGYAVLRDGAIYGEEGNSTYKNNMRDFWLYFGGSTISHAHYDTLNLGIEAFGLNMAPDIGYPEKTGNNPNRMTWVSTTLSHNTVLVDTAQPAGKLATTADPLHFDDSGAVKLMDVDASDAYAQTDIYRRTLVMIEAGPDVSYGVDFFRIKGGDEHLYSFHSQSNTISETSGLELVPQTDEDGNYIGSYAGADVPYGEDPSGSYIISQLKYPAGYTWFKNVRRASDVGKFTVDFAVSDYNKVLNDSKNLHLRMTMLNDFELSEVALAGGYVLKKSVTANLPETLEYVLAKRKGNDLDSLYTTVYEPYKADRYISDMNSVLIETEDSVGEDDTAKAIKVIRQDGRVDYITYATNNKALYTVTDGDISFKFRGFVGVYSVNAEGKAIYSYVHDGDVIGDNISEIGAVEGSVSGFERELVTSNYIDIETSEEVNPDELAGKYIFVENDGVRNAVYKIESAEKTENGARLDIGLTSVIRGYASQYNPDAGYVYDVGEGQRISIPLSGIYDGAPVFDEIKNKLTATAGSGITVKLNAESDTGCDITYVADTLPRGATIDEIAGTITWKPTSSQIGDNHFAVIARDSEGRTSTAHFIVTVYGSTTGGGNNAAGTDGSGSASGAGSGGGGAGGGGATAPSKPAEPEKPVEPETPAESETPEVEEKTFTDLENHAWAEDAINVLAKEGIIKGTTSATFSPANNITRADFAILLVRAFELESENAENFADVADNDYFAKELAIARNNGIINGIVDNKFAPRNTITRQDMMTIVYRTMVKLGVELKKTTDVEMPDADSVASYAEEAVSALIGAGLVNGKSGKIAPFDYTTRAEVAVLIKRILDFKSVK